jgi:serine/threonine-protein kinase
MSPEQCRGSRSIDGRTDLYSLGVILYRMLSGVSPFDAPTCADVIRMQLEQRPEPPSARWPDVPPELDRLVLWMLEKDPDARPRTASNVLGELERHFPERDSSHDIQRTAAVAGHRSEIIRQIDRHVAPADGVEVGGGDTVSAGGEREATATRTSGRPEGRGRRVAVGVALAALALAVAWAIWWVGR